MILQACQRSVVALFLLLFRAACHDPLVLCKFSFPNLSAIWRPSSVKCFFVISAHVLSIGTTYIFAVAPIFQALVLCLVCVLQILPLPLQPLSIPLKSHSRANSFPFKECAFGVKLTFA